MKNSKDNDTVISDKIDLKELFQVFWLGKYKIILISLFFALGSVIYSLSLPNQYKATAILAPAVGGVSDSMSRLGGLASIAGVSIGQTESVSESMLAKEIMQSWSFVENFINENELAPMLLAVESWDEQSGQLVYSDDAYDFKSKTWLDTDDPPSSWDLFEAFNGILSVEDDKSNGFIKVSIEYLSPEIAKYLVDLYVSSINKYMQIRKIQMLSKNIEYLEDQIIGNQISEMREVFFSIISEQIKDKMMAQATPDYAFVTVSPSMVPEKRSQPNRALICILGSLVGGIFSIFFVIISHYGRRVNL